MTPTVPELVGQVFGVRVDRAEPLTDGLLNESWRLWCPDHDRVLRISRLGRTVDQIRYERAVAADWAAEVPQVVQAETDQIPLLDGRPLSLYPFVPGRSGVEIDPTERAVVMAGVIARMHRVSLARGRPQRPGFASFDERPAWHRWRVARDLVRDAWPEPAVRQAVDRIDTELAALTELLTIWRGDGRLDLRATVHGDLNPRNQLWRDDELVGLVDTDDCRVEPLVWEIAQTAYGDDRSVPADRVWSAYQAAGGPVPDHDRDLLEPMARVGAMSEVQWLLEDGVDPPVLSPTARTTVLEVAGWLAPPADRDR